MFHSLIKEIWAAAPGLENLLLSGVDGIVVSRYHENEQDEFLAAEAANLIKEAQRLGGEIGSGGLTSLSTHYEDRIIVIQMVTDDYFLLGILRDPQYLGQVRYRFALKSYEWYSAIA